MLNSFKVRVYYSDTDCYNVVWHGAYIKWLERARVDFIEALGLDLALLEKDNILFPVVDLNVRYKYSAKLNDILTINTTLNSFSKIGIEFSHTILNQEGKVVLNASTKVVVIKDGRLLRTIPDNIKDAFSKKNLCYSSNT